MLEMGFAVAEGFFSIGYDGNGNPIEARRLKPEGDEITAFLDHNASTIREMWEKQIKPIHQ